MAPSGRSVVQLRIQLEETAPVVWRRLLVPGSIRLPKLHDIFQAAMGWTNSHLHSFRIGESLYGMQFDDYPDEEIDEKTVTVLQAVRGHRRFVYEYDFGDSWQHAVVVEEMLKAPNGLKYAVCIDGQNACPPEDCGGTHGCRRLPPSGRHRRGPRSAARPMTTGGRRSRRATFPLDRTLPLGRATRRVRA